MAVQSVLSAGPAATLALIFWVATTTIFIVLREYPYSQSAMDDLRYNARFGSRAELRPHRSTVYLNLAIFVAIVGTILQSFFNAVHTGGGRIRQGWRPSAREQEKRLQWCEECAGYKPPRAHHCRDCDRCVLKMDHHCVWINACVGNENQLAFLAFTTSAPLGCLHSLLMQLVYLGWTPIPTTRPRGLERTFIFFTLGITAGVVIAVGLLACLQISSIMSNMTQIESWIVEKAADCREHASYHELVAGSENFVFPYDLGSSWSNMKEFWRQNFDPAADGTHWRVAEGCTAYSLSEEQLAQKRFKFDNSTVHTIAVDSGNRCKHGYISCIAAPVTETALTLKVGDKVRVFLLENGWLYGEKLELSTATGQPRGEGGEVAAAVRAVRPRERGWFPRECSATPDRGFKSKTV